MADVPYSGTGVNTELQALTAIVQALTGLPSDAQKRVLDAVLVLVGGAALSGRAHARTTAEASLSVPAVDSPPVTSALDIRQLTEQKRPESANEMAALVAYYLAEVAGPNERRDTVDTADMEKYFKQARFKLPNNPKMTLVHAKNAGYFDAVGGGRYKVNPVGYNLAAYTLPRSGADGARRSVGPKRASRTKKKASVKATKK